MKEVELAQHFVRYLEGFDLYFEVDYYRVIDIVSINSGISAAYEVKTNFNFKVFEQAVENAQHFNFSYICVPDFRDSWFHRRLCDDYGLGLLMYDDRRGYGDVREYVSPRLNRHANNECLIERLSNVSKKSKPGAQTGDGKRITAFAVTVENAERYVRGHSGCTLKELMENITHHYRNNQAARTNFYQWIHKGVIKTLYWRYGRVHLKRNRTQ